MEKMVSTLIVVNVSFLFLYWQLVTPKTKVYIRTKKQGIMSKLKNKEYTFSDLSDLVKEYHKIRKLESNFVKISTFTISSAVLSAVSLEISRFNTQILNLEQLFLGRLLFVASISNFFLALSFAVLHMRELHRWVTSYPHSKQNQLSCY